VQSLEYIEQGAVGSKKLNISFIIRDR
jgi:hypothetical protein